jgi:hypothetical protein
VISTCRLTIITQTYLESYDTQVNNEHEAVPDEGRGGTAELIVKRRNHVSTEQEGEEDERQDIGNPEPEHTECEPVRAGESKREECSEVKARLTSSKWGKNRLS